MGVLRSRFLKESIKRVGSKTPSFFLAIFLFMPLITTMGQVDGRSPTLLPISVLALVIAAVTLILFLVFVPIAIASEKVSEEYSPPEGVGVASDPFWTDVEKLPYHFIVDVNYWRGQINLTEYAYNNVDGNSGTPILGGSYGVGMDWNWGFSVGAGYEFFHNDWNINAKYTLFGNSQTSNITNATNGPNAIGSLFALRSIALGNNAITSASSTISFLWNNLDALFDKKFHFRENIVAFTKIGLETSWLWLKDEAKYSGGATLGTNTLTSRSEAHLWGIGPKAGAQANFLFTDAVYLLGSFDTSLKYMINRSSYVEINEANASDSINFRSRNEFLSPTIDLEIGLGFARYFSEETKFVQLEANYQVHYLFQQNQLLTPEPLTPPRFQSNNADIGFQGFTISLSFRY